MKIIVNEQVNTQIEEVIFTHPTSLFEHLLTSTGYSKDDLPIAEWLRIYYGQGEGQWFICSPIYWEATHNDAVIKATASSLDLTSEDSKKWFDAFKIFVENQFEACIYINQDIWLVKANSMPAVHSIPLSQMINQSMMPELQKLDKGLNWTKFLTECQMYFNSISINDDKKHLVNGVWVWGYGTLNQKTDVSFYTDTPQLYDLLDIISNSVTHYSTEVKLTNKSILVLDKLSYGTYQSYKNKYNRYRIDWLWNNATLHQEPDGFWWRLWR